MYGYNGQQQQQQQQQQQPQQQGLYGQPTGYGFQQPNYQGGYPSQPIQSYGQPQQVAPMMTGSYPMQQQPQQTGYIQPQQTGYAPPSNPPSFAPQQTSTPAVSKSSGSGPKIPNVRLSFITSDDQKKFEQLFRSAVSPNENTVSGERAREILLRSNLSPMVLADIWQLSDTTKSGVLLFPEFALAMYLCSLVIKGQSLPAVLPETIKNEVSSLVDIISFSLADDNPTNGASSTIPSYVPDFSSRQNSNAGIQSSNTGFGSQASLNSQPTGIQSQQTGYSQPAYNLTSNALQSQLTGGYQQAPLQSQPTGGYQQAPLQSQPTGGYQQAPLQSQPTGGYQQAPLQSQPTGGYQQAPLQSQATGGFSQPLQPQRTGGFQPAPLQPQNTGGFTGGFQSQPTGGFANGLQSQTTGILPQATGIQSQYTGVQQPLQAMPTGKPGQWGFINTPGQGLPGIEALRTQLMPQKTGMPMNPTIPLSQLQGNATVEWSITKDEKQIYDGIFNAWDKQRSGFISGDVAIDVLGKSGLNRGDLETIWTLADPDNRGKLSKDEFAVAMHLIYRRLNGYPLPGRLPPELVPPSQRRLSESVSQIKNLLRTNSQNSEITGSRQSVSSTGARSKDAAVFKNDDAEMGGFTSSARHRTRKNDRVEKEPKPSYEDPDKMSISELKKAINEKQILLDAIDTKDEEDYKAVEELESRDSGAIDTLKSRILSVQKEINNYPNAPSLTEDGTVDKRQALRKLHAQTDLVPTLLSSIRRLDEEIMAAKMELFRTNYEKEHPGSTIAGTGPGGVITEWDRKKARSKAVLRRVQAMSGRGNQETTDESSVEKFEELYAQEREAITADADRYNRMFGEIQESISQLQIDMERNLKESNDDIHNDRERRRFEEAIGVEDVVKDFIYSLRRIPNNNHSSSLASPAVDQSSYSINQRAPISADSTGDSRQSSTTQKPATTHMSPVERAKYIKAEAERKMAEKLAALGITRKGRGTHSAAPPAPSEPSTPHDEEPVQSTKPVSETSTNNGGVSEKAKKLAPNAPRVAAKPSVTAAAAPVDDEESSSDDDDEELLKAKAEQEARLKKLEADAAAKKEKEALKKQKKEERRKALMAEIETARERERQLLAQQQKEDEEDSESEWDVKNTDAKPKDVVATQVAQSPAAVQPGSSVQNAKPLSEPTPVETRNPFLRDKNPFFKPTSATQNGPAKSSAPATAMSTKDAIDPSEAAAQRKKQMGQNTDDEWGDGGNESADDSSDDEANSRNPANLASMLFGSMGGKAIAQPAAPQPTTVPETIKVASESSSSSAFATPLASSVDLGDSTLTAAATPPPAPAAPPPPPPPFASTSESSETATFVDVNGEDSTLPNTETPPLPSNAPPPPPLPFSAPPAPPVPTGAPSAPSPPPPVPNSSVPSPSPAAAAPDTSGLFADILKGRSLKKVPESKQKRPNQDLGKVL